MTGATYKPNHSGSSVCVCVCVCVEGRGGGGMSGPSKKFSTCFYKALVIKIMFSYWSTASLINFYYYC